MHIRKKIDFSRVFLYLVFGIACFCLSAIGKHTEPFALALTYAISAAGLSPAVAAFWYILSSILAWNKSVLLLYTGQALLLVFAFFIQSKLKPSPFVKAGILPLLALSIGLGLFVGLAPFTAYELPFQNFELNTIFQKAIIAALIFLLSTVFSRRI